MDCCEQLSHSKTLIIPLREGMIRVVTLLSCLALTLCEQADDPGVHGSHKVYSTSALHHEEEMEKAQQWAIFWGIAALCLTFTVGFLLESNEVIWFPETGVGVLCGLGCSLGAMHAGKEHVFETMQFEYDFFMIWLLPPIIFEACAPPK